jgi:hypothetical protein
MLFKNSFAVALVTAAFIAQAASALASPLASNGGTAARDIKTTSVAVRQFATAPGDALTAPFGRNPIVTPAYIYVPLTQARPATTTSVAARHSVREATDALAAPFGRNPIVTPAYIYVPLTQARPATTTSVAARHSVREASDALTAPFGRNPIVTPAYIYVPLTQASPATTAGTQTFAATPKRPHTASGATDRAANRVPATSRSARSRPL